MDSVKLPSGVTNTGMERTKLEQALLLDPPTELHFKAPFTDVTTSYLKLTNPTDRQVCFKVKTTAPKTYCVRPNIGVVPPKETVTVAVMLQPFDFESADKSKHKFMVQSMFAPDGEINQETLWREALPESLMNSKLKCVFDISVSDNAQANVDCGDGTREETSSTASVTYEVNRNPSPKVSHLEADIKKVTEENKKLKSHLSELKQENSQLKEEGLRMRLARSTGSSNESALPSTSAQAAAQSRHQASLGMKTQSPSSMYIIVFSAVAFIIGILLGKNVF